MIKKYECNFCNFKANTKVLMNTHIIREHSDKLMKENIQIIEMEL